MEGYYKLTSVFADKTAGYVSFEPCRDKNGGCYTVKCKVDQMSDCLFLVMESEIGAQGELILRRFAPGAKGTFVYFSISASSIDDFLSFAGEKGFAVYAYVSFKGVRVARCCLVEACAGDSAFEEDSASEGGAFDPFGTVNVNYKWGPVQNINYLKAQGLIFSSGFYSVAERAFKLFGHLLAGKYTAGEAVFTIIGVPGNKQKRTYEYGRWVYAKKKYKNSQYDGYWLFYFSDDSKKMVRPVIKR